MGARHWPAWAAVTCVAAGCYKAKSSSSDRGRIAAPLPGGGDTLEVALEGFRDSGIATLGSIALLG